MARDIEDFLRRAAERRQQQLKQKQAGGQASPPPRATPPPVQPRPKPRTLVSREDIDVVDMRDQSVAEHVKSHIDTSDIASHAERLARDISQVDEKVEARLHQKFDHGLGKLESRKAIEAPPEATVDEVSATALGLVEIIRSPKTLRQAILLSEILRRPQFDDD